MLSNRSFHNFSFCQRDIILILLEGKFPIEFIETNQGNPIDSFDHTGFVINLLSLGNIKDKKKSIFHKLEI